MKTLQQQISEAAESWDGCTNKDERTIRKEYEKADCKTKKAIDKIFCLLTGYTFKTLLKNNKELTLKSSFKREAIILDLLTLKSKLALDFDQYGRPRF